MSSTSSMLKKMGLPEDVTSLSADDVLEIEQVVPQQKKNKKNMEEVLAHSLGALHTKDHTPMD